MAIKRKKVAKKKTKKKKTKLVKVSKKKTRTKKKVATKKRSATKKPSKVSKKKNKIKNKKNREVKKMSTETVQAGKSPLLDTSHLKVKFPYKAKYGNFIGGKFVEPLSGKYFDNDKGTFGKAHADADNKTAINQLIEVTEDILAE